MLESDSGNSLDSFQYPWYSPKAGSAETGGRSRGAVDYISWKLRGIGPRGLSRAYFKGLSRVVETIRYWKQTLHFIIFEPNSHCDQGLGRPVQTESSIPIITYIYWLLVEPTDFSRLKITHGNFACDVISLYHMTTFQESFPNCCSQSWKWHIFWKRTCDGLGWLRWLGEFS